MINFSDEVVALRHAISSSDKNTLQFNGAKLFNSLRKQF